MPSAAEIRKTVKLRQSLHHDLTVYALVAGAAGVSVLALTPASEARIVYTPTSQLIGRQGSYNLDVNNDGIVDYTIVESAGRLGSGTLQQLMVRARNGNQVNCVYPYCLSTFIYAAALFRGTQIGPTQQRHGWLGIEAQMAAEIDGNFFDSWNNANNRYLGLRFQINGEIHFGWARFNVRFHGGAPKDRTFEAQLTGYAYETVAGKAIRAGQTVGDAEDISASRQTAQPAASTVASYSGSPRAPDSVPLGELALGETSSLSRAPGATFSSSSGALARASIGRTSEVFVASQPQPEPATLGALSLGASGLAMWRRP